MNDTTATFRDYICERQITPTPTGDFVTDTRQLIRAGKFPDVKSWDELRGYLLRRKASGQAITAAKSCWLGYERSQRALA